MINTVYGKQQQQQQQQPLKSGYVWITILGFTLEAKLVTSKKHLTQVHLKIQSRT